MTTSLMDPLERETLAEQAVRSLKRYILTNGLTPGAQLPSERELCDSLGISRNVVREALQTLVAEGYVNKEPGRGAFVRTFDFQRLEGELYAGQPQRDHGRDLRELRVALEVGAMSFVVRRIGAEELGRLRQLVAGMEELYATGRPLRPLDREFHETLTMATHNQAMVELRQTLFRSLRLSSPEAGGEGHSRTHDENTLRTAGQIVAALEHRDLEAAERAMRAHLIFDLPPGQARLFLFVDDGDIASMHGLKRTLHQATKHYGNPVIAPEHAWEGHSVFPTATVLWDEARKEYRLWYQGYRYLASHEEQYDVCYAVSVDGVHWRKPALGIVEFAGGDQNNVLIPWGDPHRSDTMSATIFYDPEAEDAGRRYTMIYYCSGTYPMGLGIAYSADGLHWQPYADNPVDSGGSEPIGDVVFALTEPRGRRSVVYYRVRLRVRPRRTLARAESSDLYHWSGHTVILEADAGDPPGAEMYGLTPFRYGDMLLGFLWVSTENNSHIEVQLAASRDGLNWQRVGERQPFLPRGPEGTFDAAVVGRTSVPVVVGNELWFYYMGASAYPPANPPAGLGCIGLATLTMDRFISLEAGDAEGMVTTKPIAIGDQTRLLLNAVANPGGYVLVEALDTAGAPLPGFTREEAIPFQHTAVFHAVEWAGACDLSALSGKTVQLRFILRKAHLFAFRLSRPDAAAADLVAGIC